MRKFYVVWAYIMHALAAAVRLWALPFFVLGWLVGVTVDAFGLGWTAAFECSIGKWAANLRRSHQPRLAQLTDAELVPPNDGEDDSFDDEE